MAHRACNSCSGNRVIGRYTEGRNTFLVSALLVSLGIFMFAGVIDQSDAMSTCQQTHAFDTCFAAMNR